MVDAPRSAERRFSARRRRNGLAALPVLLLGLPLGACDGDCAKSAARSGPDRAPEDAIAPAMTASSPPPPASPLRMPASPPQMTGFDDFSSGRIDPSRWTPKDSLRGFADGLSAPHAAQLTRRVEDGALHLSSSLEGEAAPGPGTAVAHFRSTLTDPTGVVALEATVTVHGVHTASCASNPAFTFTRATIGGLFFNSGESQGRQLVGDVLAVVGVGRRSDSSDPPDRLRVMAVVVHCRRPCYAFAEHLPPKRHPSEVVSMQDLGAIQVGQSTRLGLGWDEPGDRFVFWRDGKVVHQVDSSLSDRSAPTILRRHLDVAHFVPRCDGGPVARSSLDVSFDDVAVQIISAGPSPSG